MNPRDHYDEYIESLRSTGDLAEAMTYTEWLEEELREAWEENGVPYL